MGEACSAWYSPCLPWVRRYQLLPSRRACPAGLEGPEPQGGRLGQLHPVRERTLWWAAPPPGTQSPFPPLLPLPRPLWVSPSTPPSFHLHPPSLLPFHPEDHTGLTYFGTIRARSAGEAAGPLEALGTGGATFSWETSFTLEQRHHGPIRQRQEENGEPGRRREVGAELDWWAGGGGGGPGPGAAVLLGQAGRTAQRGHLGMANRTLTLGPTRPGAPASPGTP